MNITVVIPLFNKQQTIARALGSVLAQTHSQWEALVVDDGSTDDGAAVVQQCTDPRVRLIRQSNQGVSAARNVGVRAARTEWVSFLDADDEYAPEFLAALNAFVERHSGEGLAMAACNHANGPGQEPIIQPGTIPPISSYFPFCPGSKTPANSSATLVNRDCTLAVGGFPENMKIFEDWTLWMKLACQGSFGFVDEVLSYYHQDHAERASVARRPPDRIFQDAERLLATAAELQARLDLAPSLRKEIVAYANRFIIRSAAPALITNGGKGYALRLLDHYDRGAFSLEHVGAWLMIARQLATPHWMRNVRRRIAPQQKQIK